MVKTVVWLYNPQEIASYAFTDNEPGTSHYDVK